MNCNLKIKGLGAMVILFVLSSFFVVNLALAHDSDSDNAFWTPGEPIVPCGQGTRDSGGRVLTCPAGVSVEYCEACTKCELLHLVRHLIDFIMIVAAPILATTFFIIAGVYIMLGGANPGMLSQGKRIFKDTFMGLVIVMLAWLITNTIIQTLINPGAVTGFTSWWQVSCSQIGF